MSKFTKLFKKELTYFLRDKKTLITSILMVSLITPGIFYLMSRIEESNAEKAEKTVLKVAIDKKDENNEFVQILKNQQKTEVQVSEVDLNKELKDNKIQGYLKIENQEGVENFTYVTDESNNDSTGSLRKIMPLIGIYEKQKQEKILNEKGLNLNDINKVSFKNKTLQELEGSGNALGIMSFLIPYMILLGLIQGAMNYAVELTAGEKERNTLATTLSLNASPRDVALAKIGAVSVMSFLFGTLSIASLWFSFNNFNMMGGEGAPKLSLNLTQIGQLLVVVLPLALLISALMIAVGVYARNAKEGMALLSPLLIIAIMLSFGSNMFDNQSSQAYYGVPILGHILSIKQIIFANISNIQILIITLSTIIFFTLLVILTTKLFKKEEVLFRV